MKCDKCKGTGEEPIKGGLDRLTAPDNAYIEYYKVCNRCNGTKEIDWIDYIIPTEYQTVIKSRMIVTSRYDIS